MKTSLTTSALLIVVIAIAVALGSCVVTTAPDGTRTSTIDQQAINPWLELAMDLYLTPQPPVAPIVIEAGKN